MQRQRWKAIEREWAGYLNGTRVPVTGRKSGDVPDIDHDYLAIEIKASSRQLNGTMARAIEQAQKAARATGRLPVVGWTMTGGRGRAAEHYVTFPLDAWLVIQQYLDDSGFTVS